MSSRIKSSDAKMLNFSLRTGHNAVSFKLNLRKLNPFGHVQLIAHTVDLSGKQSLLDFTLNMTMENICSVSQHHITTIKSAAG